MNEMTPPRVTVSEGRMIVSGVPGSFVQGAARPLRLEAEALEPVGGYALRESVLQDDRRLEGVARVVGDQLSRIGAAASLSERLSFTIRSFPESAAAQRILLGIEVSGAETETDELAATLWLPAAAFAALRQDLLEGQAGLLSLSATTNLWVLDNERDSPPDRPLTWHLGLAADGSALPARGLVETLSWRAAASVSEPDMPVAAEPAPVQEDEAETTADVLSRVNWTLRQLVLVLVFLLVVIALKR